MNSLAMGGSESKIIGIANDISSGNIAAHIAYLNPPITLLNRIEDSVNVSHLERNGKYSARALRRLIGVLRTAKIDVVFAVNLYPCFYAVPARWILGSRCQRPKIVALVNTTDFIRRRDKLFASVYAAVLKRCDRIIFGCEFQKIRWQSLYKIPTQSCSVIYNGVDTEKFSRKMTDQQRRAKRAKIGLSAQSMLIVSIGRLQAEKDFALLIRAFTSVVQEGHDTKLVIAGEGSERQALEDLILRNSVMSNVQLPGRIEDVGELLECADLFVLPSKAVETFSNAALEAMSMSVPTILSRIGGAAEMIEDGKSGLLFEPEDEEALTILLRKQLADRLQSVRIGAAGRKKVEENFSKKKMLLNYVQEIARSSR